MLMDISWNKIDVVLIGVHFFSHLADHDFISMVIWIKNAVGVVKFVFTALTLYMGWRKYFFNILMTF